MRDLVQSTPTPIDMKALGDFCAAVGFSQGDLLRVKGRHYRDMYWLTSGRVKVDFGDDADVPNVAVVDAGWPIGEIGFLLGTPAAATVTAASAVTALVIDDAALARIDREQPALAARLLRVLAGIAESRKNWNTTYAGASGDYARGGAIEIRLCRGRDMIEAAQRLRYEVSCGELGRSSPAADHDRKIISDALDAAGYTFVAIEAGEVIGTLRVNFARDGPLGALDDLYGMKRSPHHPTATAVCTRFVVRKSRRRSPAAIKLIAAVSRHCSQNGIAEVYIDCIPALLPYFKAIGFRVAGERFYHRENGPSYPMMIDVARHQARWSEELSLLQYLQLYIKAKAIRWIDGLRAHQTRGGRAEQASG